MLVFQPIDHVSVSPTDGIGPTQGQRKTLNKVGIEPTTFGFDHRCSTDCATGSDGSSTLVTVHYVWVTLIISGDNDMNGDTNKFFMTTVTKTGPLTREANLHPGLLRKIFF